MNETVTFLLKAKSAHVEVLHDKFPIPVGGKGVGGLMMCT